MSATTEAAPAGAGPAGAATGASSGGAETRRARRCAVAIVAFACLPIVVATIRALLHHWIPVGDDGLLAIRVQDVFSRHVPLLGTASSASFAASKPLNNPGPLYFDLVSIPVWAFGSAAGTAIGVALVNLGAMATIGAAAWRRAGVVGTALASLIAATLAWSMGSELLYDVWQPHALLLPFLAFLFVTWCVVEGDFVFLPVAVLIGSVLLQTHLTYGYLTPLLLVTGLVVGILRHRGATEGRRVLRWSGAALLVGLVAWTPSLIEQFTTSDGNMSRLLRQIQHPPKAVVGGSGALRLTATVLAKPPFWLRNSFTDTFHPPGTPYGSTASTVTGAGAASVPHALIGVGAVVAVLLGLAWWARRRHDRPIVGLMIVALVALAGSWFTASKVTTDIVGVAPHQFRFLWPMSAFVLFAVLLAVLRWLPSESARSVAVIGVVVATGVMTAWNLPTSTATVGPQLDESLIPVQRDLDRQLGPVGRSQPVKVEFSKIRFGEPFSGAIMAEMRRRGIEFVTTDAYLARQLGPLRASNGHDAKVKVFYRTGDEARSPHLGPFRRVAFHDGLTRVEHTRFVRLRTDIARYLVAHGLQRTSKLQAGIDIGIWKTLAGPFTAADVQRVFDRRELAGATDAHALKLRQPWRGRFEEYARLQRIADERTVGVYLGPVDAAAP